MAGCSRDFDDVICAWAVDRVLCCQSLGVRSSLGRVWCWVYWRIGPATYFTCCGGMGGVGEARRGGGVDFFIFILNVLMVAHEHINNTHLCGRTCGRVV